MPSLIDLTGNRYGRLVVISRDAPKKGYHGAMWRCRCDCGNETIVNSQNLKSGNTTSCGCYGIERRTSATTKHHCSRTRLYRIWKAMKTRCYNNKFPGFRYYGLRGIKVCSEWLMDFGSFMAWAMANGYQENLTIDRINTNGDYCPDNCRWATMEEQNKNKRAPNGCRIKEK